MIQRAARSTLAVLALLGGAWAAAQQPPGAPSFPAEAGVITVDVVILDKAGRPVAGLTRDAFTVLDDGRAQAIAAFERRELQAAAPAADELERPAVSSNGETPAGTGRVLAFVIDDLGLKPVLGAADAKKALARWLDEKADPRDEVTLVTTSGDVWWSDAVGRGRADLRAVLEHVQGKRDLGSLPESMTDWEAHRIVEAGPVPHPGASRPDVSGADPAARIAASAERSRQSQVFMRATQLEEASVRRQRALLRIVERLAEAFANRRGRKSVFILSETLIPDTPPGAARRAIEAAQRANVAVYVLDARGLVGDSRFRAENPAAPPEAAGLAERLAATAAGDDLAQATGGRLIGGTNDLFGGLSGAADESSAYYLLGYPAQGPPDGRWHELEVRVNRPGLTVRARRGYLARPASPEASAETERAGVESPPEPPLALSPDLGDVPLRLSCRALGKGEGGLRVLVALDVGVSALAFTPDAPGRSPSGARALFDVALVSIGRDRPLREDFTQRVTLRSDGAARSPWWSFAHEALLPPGATQLRAIVRDAVTGRTGLVTHRFDVPEAVSEPPRDFVHAAGAFVFEARGGKRQTAILVEIPAAPGAPSDGAAEGPRFLVVAQITDASGHAIERLTETLAGGFPVRWRGSAALAPGDYTLETSVLDPATASLSVSRHAFHVAGSESLAVSSLVIPMDGTATDTLVDATKDPFQVGGVSFWPRLDARVSQGTAELPILFHVYPAAQADEAPLALTLAVFRGEERLVESPLPPPQPDANGRLSWTGVVPAAALPPGSYTIVARGTQGERSAEERLTFAVAGPAKPVASSNANANANANAPELTAVLRKAGQYVSDYKRTFRDLVAEESYEQRAGTRTRSTRADVAFVTLAGPFSWGSFRDVFEVDGQAVRDHQARLEELFVKNRASALERAGAIRNESARYNIGVTRTINEPTLPLAFLQPGNQERFEFESGGREPLAGRDAAVVAFRERKRPTMVAFVLDSAGAERRRQPSPAGRGLGSGSPASGVDPWARGPSTDAEDEGPRGSRPVTRNLPASGRFWIDPETGTVLRCEVQFRMPTGSKVRVEVDYQPEEGLAIWVPREMRERYESQKPVAFDPNAVQATARYTRFRRFGVETQELGYQVK